MLNINDHSNVSERNLENEGNNKKEPNSAASASCHLNVDNTKAISNTAGFKLTSHLQGDPLNIFSNVFRITGAAQHLKLDRVFIFVDFKMLYRQKNLSCFKRSERR